MKRLYGIKLKIFLVIFLSSILFLNLARSQEDFCYEELATGFLESPKFCFKSKAKITKFIWKGILEGNPPIKVTLQGFQTSTAETPIQTISFYANPGRIYTNGNNESNYLLENIQCLRYKIELKKCLEDTVPRIDQIFIYYSF